MDVFTDNPLARNCSLHLTHDMAGATHTALHSHWAGSLPTLREGAPGALVAVVHAALHTSVRIGVRASPCVMHVHDGRICVLQYCETVLQRDVID